MDEVLPKALVLEDPDAFLNSEQSGKSAEPVLFEPGEAGRDEIHAH